MLHKDFTVATTEAEKGATVQANEKTHADRLLQMSLADPVSFQSAP